MRNLLLDWLCLSIILAPTQVQRGIISVLNTASTMLVLSLTFLSVRLVLRANATYRSLSTEARNDVWDEFLCKIGFISLVCLERMPCMAYYYEFIGGPGGVGTPI